MGTVVVPTVVGTVVGTLVGTLAVWLAGWLAGLASCLATCLLETNFACVVTHIPGEKAYAEAALYAFLRFTDSKLQAKLF